MNPITVVRPDWEGDATGGAGPVRAIRPADRPTLPLPEPVVIGLVDNRKPNANRLLRLVAEELGHRIPVARVEVYSKPASSRPMDPDAAKVMAARAHLVICGIGD
jgi:hypothetical protein